MSRFKSRVIVGGRSVSLDHGALMEAHMRNEIHERALRALTDLLAAVTQAGPGPRDLDIDHDALAGVVTNARTILYEAGRLQP